MAGRDRDGSPVSPELAELSARLRRDEPVVEVSPVPKRDPRRRRRIVFRVLRWFGVTVLALAALVLFSIASLISAENHQEIATGAKPVQAAQGRIYAAEDAKADLPETAEAVRWLEQAREAGQQVAGFQNIYLVETGPLSLTGIPTVDPDPTPGTRAKTYTQAQRHKLAQQRRDQKVSGLNRSMEPYFGEAAQDSDGFNAISRWQDSVGSLRSPGEETPGEKVSLAAYAWSFPEVYAFQDDGTVAVAWQLRTTSSKRLAGWVNGTYDPETKTFGDLSIGTIAKEAK